MAEAITEKLCKGECGLVKPLQEFGLNGANRRRSYCYPCDTIRSKAWKAAHPELARAQGNKWARENRDKCNIAGRRFHLRNGEKRRAKKREDYGKNRESILQDHKQRRRDLKRRVVDGYGGQCTCCGETDIRFLTIDHVHGDGNLHRRAVGGGNVNVYRWAIAEGFPDALQALCFNCNMGRQYNGGICPHEETRLRLAA